jgi:hypothetical protein
MYDGFRSEVEAESAFRRHQRGEKPVGGSLLARLFGLALLILGAGLYELLKVVAEWLWRQLVGGVNRHAAAVGVAAIILLAGYVFFEFRRAKPTYYGLVEVGFGVMTGVRWIIASGGTVEMASQAFDTKGLLELVSGTYLVVRGLDNLGKRKREREDRDARTEEVLQLVTESLAVQVRQSNETQAVS